MKHNWPLVTENDPGIKEGAAGKGFFGYLQATTGPRNDIPGLLSSVRRCYYCNQAVGEPHGKKCVMVTKLVELLWTATLVSGEKISFVENSRESHASTKEEIEFRYNEGTWCSDNLYDKLDRLQLRQGYDRACVDFEREFDALVARDGCLCQALSVEHVQSVDDTPTVWND